MGKKAALGVVGALAIVGAVATLGSSGSAPGSKSAGSPSAGVAASPAPVKSPAYELNRNDVTLTVKVTEKKCFGSAGCNVMYEVRAAVARPDFDGDYAVTYEVKGPEDGPAIGTLTLQDDGTYNVQTEIASTPRSSTKLVATVTDLEKK